MTDSLTPAQEVVLRAMHEFGRPVDDTALAVYVHHIANRSMSSSGIRSRRAELSRPTETRGALIEAFATKRLPSNRRAAIHRLTAEGRKAAESFGATVTL